MKYVKQHDIHELVDKLKLKVFDIVYSNPRLALFRLESFSKYLDVAPNSDFPIYFYRYEALILNQLYDYEASDSSFDKAMNLVTEYGDLQLKISILIDYAGLKINRSSLDEAVDLLEKAKQLLTSFPNPRAFSYYQSRLGVVELTRRNRKLATSLFFESEKGIVRLAEYKKEDYYYLTSIYNGLGDIFTENGDFEKSLDMHLKIIDICEAEDMKSRISWHYLNTGNSFSSLNKFKEAKEYFNKAIKNSDDISDMSRALAHANLGYCYYKEDKYYAALKEYKYAEELHQNKRQADKRNLCIIERWKAQLYIAKGKRSIAQQCLAKAFKYAKDLQETKSLMDVYSDISKYYADGGNFEEAYRYQQQLIIAIEKNEKEKQLRNIAELQIKYDTERKKWKMEKLQSEANSLQLRALQSQMNPHFLSNALNSIQKFVNCNDSHKASRAIATFADLMRKTLELSNQEDISIEEEIQFLTNYLEVNKNLRFDNITYDITIKGDLEEDIFFIPVMIIQPFVENAIEHGIRSVKNGHIEIEFSYIDDEKLLCIVTDNGIGRKAAALNKSQNGEKKKSFSTNITSNRLEILQKSQLTKNLSVQYHDLKNGTKVEIIIPILRISV